MTERDYKVYGPDGEVLCYLNDRLAIRQGITDEQLEALKVTHQLKHMLFEAAKKYLERPTTLRMLAASFDSLETEQQKLWNFNPDPSFHRFFDFPGCTCPKIDNAERLGIPQKIHSLSCSIHNDHDRPRLG